MSTAPAPDAVWTVLRLLNWTRDYFQRARLEAPRLRAELLLAHAMGCERIRLYTRFEEVPGEDVRTRFRDLVQQAAAGRPIAYLTGTKEFFSLTFEVTPDVLIPRPETEVLVERAIHLVRQADPAIISVLDLGAGSGCIAVSLAHSLPDLRVFASDISPAALAVAERNAARRGLAARIEFRAGDLFAPWTAGAAAPPPFDLIVANPPYIATLGAPVAADVRDNEPHVALFAGEDGLAIIRRIAAEAPAHLAPGGRLLLEIAFDQAAAVRALLAAHGWRDIVMHRDGAGHERVVHARR